MAEKMLAKLLNVELLMGWQFKENVVIVVVVVVEVVVVEAASLVKLSQSLLVDISTFP
jgi:hypothetical protein